jgi:hypothetical protein
VKTSHAIAILVAISVTAHADLTPEEIYAARLAAADRSAQEKKDVQKTQEGQSSTTWEQRAREEADAYRARHEEALRRESPAARAAREKEEHDQAERRAAAEAWCAEHPVECAAQRKAEEAARAERQAGAARAAALQRQKQEAEAAARKMAFEAGKKQVETARHVAARAEDNLNTRVINALSAPSGVLVGPSPDQQRVAARAWAIAEMQFPVSRVSRGSGTIDENYGERQKLAQHLMSDEAFVRDTLK